MPSERFSLQRPCHAAFDLAPPFDTANDPISRDFLAPPERATHLNLHAATYPGSELFGGLPKNVTRPGVSYSFSLYVLRRPNELDRPSTVT